LQPRQETKKVSETSAPKVHKSPLATFPRQRKVATEARDRKSSRNLFAEDAEDLDTERKTHLSFFAKRQNNTPE
jgi:hypothetical protein